MTSALVAGALCACLFAERSGGVAAEPREVSVQGSARASFEITPLVQELSGRRGQKLPFSFQVRALEFPQSLSIRAVGLRQQPNGLIVADEQAPPPEALSLPGAAEIELKAEQTATIRGEVEVPLSSAPFHVFGVLVTDEGRPLQPGSPAAPASTAVQVRFVTQYLLRVEVRVTGGFSEDAKRLRAERGGLDEQEGDAFAQVEIVNPTDAAVEFQLFARLLHADGRPVTSEFGLALPVRASRPEPARFDSRVFARTSVRVEAPVPEPVFPGDYRLEVFWLSRRRQCGKASFPVTVREGDFPALEAKIARVGEDLRIVPAQIGLSVRQGGSRRRAVRFNNEGPRPLAVRLSAETAEGSAADWALVSPAEFTLAPGSGRNVLIAARPGIDAETHRYGTLRVAVRAEGESTGESRDLPLALLTPAEIHPRIAVGALRWGADDGRPGFAMPVENRGDVHVSLHGRLGLDDSTGRRVELAGGFDRWLVPGERATIRFPSRQSFAAGDYRVFVQIETGQGQEPIRLDQTVRITGAADDRTSPLKTR